MLYKFSSRQVSGWYQKKTFALLQGGSWIISLEWLAAIWTLYIVLNFFILIEISGKLTIFQHLNTSINSIEAPKFSRQFQLKIKIVAKFLEKSWEVTFPHFVNFTLSPRLCCSPRITNCGMREKKIFCINDSFGVSRYIKRGRK